MSLYVHRHSKHVFLFACVCVHVCVCVRSRASRSMLPKGRGRQPDPGHSMTLHPDLCCDCLNYPSSWQRETERARGSMCVAVNGDGWFLILVSFISCKLMFPQSPLIFLSVHSCSHLLFHRHLNPKHSVLTKPSISTSFHVFHHTGTSSWITNQAKLPSQDICITSYKFSWHNLINEKYVGKLLQWRGPLYAIFFICLDL